MSRSTSRTGGCDGGPIAVNERYAVDAVLPDERVCIYDLSQPDEPCVYVAENADEADRWIEEQMSTESTNPCEAHRNIVAEGFCPVCLADERDDAESHLWALVVWFGVSWDNPYATRDVRAASAYLERRGLTDPERMRERHIAAREALDG